MIRVPISPIGPGVDVLVAPEKHALPDHFGRNVFSGVNSKFRRVIIRLSRLVSRVFTEIRGDKAIGFMTLHDLSVMIDLEVNRRQVFL